jgi:hypothetical protein
VTRKVVIVGFPGIHVEGIDGDEGRGDRDAVEGALKPAQLKATTMLLWDRALRSARSRRRTRAEVGV